MTKKQTYALKMYQSIDMYIKDSCFESRPKVYDIMEDFRSKISKIEIIANEIENVTTEIRKKLCQAGADIEFLLAKNTKTLNYGISPSVSLFYSALFRKSKDQLVESLQKICKEASLKMDVLSRYGITPAVMEYVDLAIVDFWTGCSINSSIRQKEKQLKALFHEADLLLKDLDKEAELYSKENSDFHVAYTVKRMRILAYKSIPNFSKYSA